MVNSYKGRSLEIGQKVKVYFNLHTHLFSVQDYKTGKVVAHGNNISLKDVEFRVSEAGRQRVLKEKKKNVHAYVIGTYHGDKGFDAGVMKDAYYNPYTHSHFVDSASQQQLNSADVVYLADKTIKYL